MVHRITVFLLLLFVATLAVHSQSAENDVEVQLATSNGITKFRIGDPIPLKLSFVAQRGEYYLDHVSSKPGSSHEQVAISPRKGVFDWSTQYTGGRPHQDCVVSRSKLSETPTVVELKLNDFVRFDRSGTYTIRFETKRISNSAHGTNDRAVMTNEIRVEIVQMSEAEEAEETKRLSYAIDAAKGNWQEQTRIAEQLSYLTGKTSTREKVKRFLNPILDVPGNYYGEIRWGLYIARDRAIVISLLEEAFRDPHREVDHGLLHTISSLRALNESPGGKPYTEELYRRVLDGYLRELAESFPKRKGIPLGAAAIAVLQNLPVENSSSAILAKVRSILLADFDTYNMYSREHLMRAYWEQLKDQSLVTSLERMLKEKSYPDYAKLNVHTTALKRLIELDSLKARPYVIAQIQDADSLVYDEAIDGLPDEFLPEVDDALLKQITRFVTGASNSVRLRAKLLQASRYATGSIYDQLLELYRAHGDSWQYDARGILLGYFLRHRPEEGLTMIKEALTAVDEGMRSSLFHNATRNAFPPEAAAFFESQLASEDPRIAGTGAYILASRGSGKHKALIQERLDRWVKQWTPRRVELEGSKFSTDLGQQAMLQVELISAMTQAKAWKLSANEIEALRSKCLIEACRHYFPREPNR